MSALQEEFFSRDNPFRILAVDDQEENLDFLKKIITGDDLSLTCALSGREGLEAAKENEFCLLLLDVQMPEMDGYELADLLLEQIGVVLPIIFLTATASSEKDISRGYEAGAVDYLIKPFKPRILRQKVRIFRLLYEKMLLIEKQNRELQEAVDKIELLGGFIRICCKCKKIHNAEDESWENIELYIRRYSDADFSHGLCPECYKKAMSEMSEKRHAK